MRKNLLYFALILILSCSGGSSDDTSTLPQENKNPGTFAINTSDITETETTLSWSAAVDPDGDNVKYSILNGNTTVVNDLDVLTFKLENLTENTQYQGKVIASDGEGGSSEAIYAFTTEETSSTGNTIAFNIPSDLISYYSDVVFYEDAAMLKDELAAHTIAKHATFLTYSARHNYLYNADADLNNAANVILMYTAESRDEREYLSGNNSHSPQTFNTEHVYPQSLISNTAKGDLHHLRACDTDVNSSRANYPFTEGSGSYGLINGNSWYPGDDWKGDVARMIMYLNLRYDENFNDVGNLDLFLKWNAEDPVSEFENQRNDIIQNAQGNRNPLIDNPYLATLIWGGDAAENLWN